MPEWKSQDEITKDGMVFAKLIHVLFGLYLWEFVTSMGFDIQMFLGRKRFKWPLIFYFAGRYSLLFALLGIIIALNVTSPINCQALYIFDQIFGNAAIGFASINLSLRTMAVWSQSLYIVIPLVLIILGHWSLLLHGLLIKAAWVPNVGCQITNTSNKILAATFVYSMAFDFTVLCLTAIRLFFPRSGRSHLVNLIFRDGLIFFIVAFLANLLATILMIMNLNPVMSIIFNVPAAVASTIVASRAVRRLSAYADAHVRGNVPPADRFPRPIDDNPNGDIDLHDVQDPGERCWRCKMRNDGVLEDDSYETKMQARRKKRGGLTFGVLKNLRGGLSLSENVHSGGKMGVDVRGPPYTSTLAFRGVDDFTSMGTSSGSAGTSSGAFIITSPGTGPFTPGKLGLSSAPHTRLQGIGEHNAASRQEVRGIMDLTEEKDGDVSPTSDDTKDTSPSSSLPPALSIPPLSPLPPAPVSQTVRVHMSGPITDEGRNGRRARNKWGSWDGRFDGDLNSVSQTRASPSILTSRMDAGESTSRIPLRTARRISHEGLGDLELETREAILEPRTEDEVGIYLPTPEPTGSTIVLPQASSAAFRESVSLDDPLSSRTVGHSSGYVDQLHLLLGDEDDLGVAEDRNGTSGHQSLPHSRPRSRLSSSASRRPGPLGAAEKILGIGVSMRPSSPSSSLSIPHSRLYSRPQLPPTPPSASPKHSIMDGHSAPFRPSSPSRSDFAVEAQNNSFEPFSSASASPLRTGTAVFNLQDTVRRSMTPPPRIDTSRGGTIDDATELSKGRPLTNRRSFNLDNESIRGAEIVTRPIVEDTGPRPVEYDASGNIVREGMYMDYEAQEISWEFRRPPY